MLLHICCCFVLGKRVPQSLHKPVKRDQIGKKKQIVCVCGWRGTTINSSVYF